LKNTLLFRRCQLAPYRKELGPSACRHPAGGPLRSKETHSQLTDTAAKSRNQEEVCKEPCKGRCKTDHHIPENRYQQNAYHRSGRHLAHTSQHRKEAESHSLNGKPP